MRILLPALINSSFAGVLWTPEVRGSKTGEEWVRRMQTVCFSPIGHDQRLVGWYQTLVIPGSGKRSEEIALLRMQLMPYFYTEFAKYHFEGTPPFRAMNWCRFWYHGSV